MKTIDSIRVRGVRTHVPGRGVVRYQIPYVAMHLVDVGGTTMLYVTRDNGKIHELYGLSTCELEIFDPMKDAPEISPASGDLDDDLPPPAPVGPAPRPKHDAGLETEREIVEAEAKAPAIEEDDPTPPRQQRSAAPAQPPPVAPGAEPDPDGTSPKADEVRDETLPEPKMAPPPPRRRPR